MTDVGPNETQPKTEAAIVAPIAVLSREEEALERIVTWLRNKGQLKWHDMGSLGTALAPDPELAKWVRTERGGLKKLCKSSTRLEVKSGKIRHSIFPNDVFLPHAHQSKEYYANEL